VRCRPKFCDVISRVDSAGFLVVFNVVRSVPCVLCLSHLLTVSIDRRSLLRCATCPDGDREAAHPSTTVGGKAAQIAPDVREVGRGLASQGYFVGLNCLATHVTVDAVLRLTWC